MSKAPGYEKWPDHEIREESVGQRVTVRLGGEILADSSAAIRLNEDNYPPRYYFPKRDVHMDQFERTESTSSCPFKGQANYYDVVVGEKRLQDVAWIYEDPYDEHRALKDHIAFYEEKDPALLVQVGG